MGSGWVHGFESSSVGFFLFIIIIVDFSFLLVE